MAQWVKNPPAVQETQERRDSAPGSGRSPGVGNGNPLKCFCLENLVDRGAWQAAVHRVAELDTTEHAQHCIQLCGALSHFILRTDW